MSFINEDIVATATPLEAVHYEFPRAKALREAFVRCVTDYYVKAKIGHSFEARGLIVTGHSRVGKTQEMTKLIDEFNSSKTLMPDGRPARIIYCKLSGMLSWKDLGRETLDALGYSASSRRTQSEIWSLVLHQAREQGVIGIYYDECQHVFVPKAKSNRIFLDSFKSMMKEPQWPFIMILSGVPVLADYVHEEEQLSHLLTPVHFNKISLGRKSDPEKDPDMLELNKLVFAYADQAGIDVEDLVDVDFLERLDFSCASRWGLVIELLINVFTHCGVQGKPACSIKDFAEVYGRTSRLPKGLSPFTAPDYQDAFDTNKLLKILN